MEGSQILGIPYPNPDIYLSPLPTPPWLQLAPLVDAGTVRLEGLVPRGSTNRFKIPADIALFGLPEERTVTVNGLRRLGLKIEDRRGGGGGSCGGSGEGGSGSLVSPPRTKKATAEEVSLGIEEV